MCDVIVHAPLVGCQAIYIFLSLVHQLSGVITPMRLRLGSEHDICGNYNGQRHHDENRNNSGRRKGAIVFCLICHKLSC